MKKRIASMVFAVIILTTFPKLLIASNYNYDQNSRLKSETYIKENIQYQRIFTYDNNGNILGKYSTSKDFLILESSFDARTESTNFKIQNSFFSLSNNIFKEGAQSLYFHSPQPTVATVESIMIDVAPNTLYTLSGWINNKLTSGNASIDWLEYNSSHQLIYDGGTIVTVNKNKWQYDREEFITKPQTAKIILRVVLDGGAAGEAYFDDIKFEKGNTLPISFNSFELYQNSWYTDLPSSVFTYSTDGAKDGKQSLRFYSNYPLTATAECGDYIVTPNTKYVLSGWINNSLSTGNTYVDWLEYNNAGELVFDGGFVYATGKNKTWQHSAVEFTTKPTTTKIVIRAVADEGATGTVYFDAIQFSKGEKLPLLETDFEENDLIWYASSPEISLYRGFAKDGLTSMKFFSNKPVTATADYGQIIVTPNTKYKLSASLYNSLNTGVLYVDWLEFNAKGELIYDGGTLFNVTKKQWGDSEIEFTTKSQTSSVVLRIVCDSGATGTAYVDNIKFINVP
ncbi:hypothetical protein C2I18_00995 [Paenibacillus sp. PK3_47]|uniref:hypothetical protein n=1 Tax=Paenibacillus sp. PK3_47 TaxID=2072642 RepID=UPI00201DB05A|nr:hypothetical protein [Paenibacillus sp. PK3_47]UQZ32244.1 hypothetical protein C2I18_00995 [Paenibacillus sp. PK3_47]